MSTGRGENRTGLPPEVIPWIAVIMGTTTGVFGGILRDVFSGRTPLIFSQEIYATACIGGCLIFFALSALGIDQPFAFMACGVFVTVIRIMAFRHGWRLPISPVFKIGQ